MTVSEADDLPGQAAEAVAFLHRHRADLLRLSGTAEVDGLVLDFGIPCRDVLGQFDEFPAPLVRAAGELGMSLGLSQYAIDGEGQNDAGGAA